jgi:hypothetical protein
MMAPHMSLPIFFLAQPQNGKGVTARYSPILSAVADEVIE